MPRGDQHLPQPRELRDCRESRARPVATGHHQIGLQPELLLPDDERRRSDEHLGGRRGGSSTTTLGDPDGQNLSRLAIPCTLADGAALGAKYAEDRPDHRRRPDDGHRRACPTATLVPVLAASAASRRALTGERASSAFSDRSPAAPAIRSMRQDNGSTISRQRRDEQDQRRDRRHHDHGQRRWATLITVSVRQPAARLAHGPDHPRHRRRRHDRHRHQRPPMDQPSPEQHDHDRRRYGRRQYAGHRQQLDGQLRQRAPALEGR